MKLATLRDGSRDGQLVVVSSDLQRYTPAGPVAGTLQGALDDWTSAADGLKDLFDRLDLGQIEGEAFDEAACLSPLPRAYQWADGSAYINHVELVRKARNADVPEKLLDRPADVSGRLGQRSWPARGRYRLSDDQAWGIDFEAEVAVITDDVPMGVSARSSVPATSSSSCWSTTSVCAGSSPANWPRASAFFQSKPSSAFSPVAVAPERWAMPGMATASCQAALAGDG